MTIFADSTAGPPGRWRALTVAIIPSAGAAARLERCLSSVELQTLPFARVLVVDDGGAEKLEDLIADRSAVDVLRLERRSGFAAAVNAGIRTALEDPAVTAVALVNDDVRLDPDWHRAAASALGEARDIGSCATVVVQSRNRQRLDSAGIDWLPGAIANNRGHGDPPPAVEAPACEVWGASAAAALYRRELFERIGLFDASFIAYQEDVELALRARLHGWRCVLAPAARAEHDGFASNRPFSGGGTWADFYNARNRVSLLLTTLPAGVWRRQWRRIVSRHLGTVLRSARERRAPAVWLGTLHALWRIPSSLERRRRMVLTGIEWPSDEL
jgi:GT2 family glycosyltransferase